MDSLRRVEIGKYSLLLPREAVYSNQITIPLRPGQQLKISVFHQFCPIPKYNLWLLDTQQKHAIKKKSTVFFIIPQGQQQSYSFSQLEGISQILKSIGHSRLVMVTLNHGFSFNSLSEVQQDLTEIAQKMSPPMSNKGIDFMTNQDIGQRGVVHYGNGILVQDVKQGDHYLRQLIFLNNIDQIQSQIRIKIVQQSEFPLIAENSPAAAYGVLQADFSYLSVEYLRAQVVTLGINIQQVLNQAYKVLILGAGGCVLPAFLRNYFENIDITGVDVEPQIIDISRRFFNVVQSPNFQTVIQDAQSYFLSCSQSYNWILLDICIGSNTQPTPPFHFTEQNYLLQIKQALDVKGILTINVIASQSQRDLIVSRVFKVFPNLYFAACKEDTNWTLYCLKEEVELDVRVLTRNVDRLVEVKRIDPTMNLVQYASWVKRKISQVTNIAAPQKKKNKKRRRN